MTKMKIRPYLTVKLRMMILSSLTSSWIFLHTTYVKVEKTNCKIYLYKIILFLLRESAMYKAILNGEGIDSIKILK